MEIPLIKKAEFIKVDNDNSIDCFYGIENEYDKIHAMEKIQNEMSDYSLFTINYDFKNNLRLQKQEWTYIDNVMIYENRETRDATRVLVDGKNNYECILWMSAQK